MGLTGWLMSIRCFNSRSAADQISGSRPALYNGGWATLTSAEDTQYPGLSTVLGWHVEKREQLTSANSLLTVTIEITK